MIPMFEALGFLEIFPLILIFASLFGVITTNNAIKTLIYMTVLNAGVITFWIVLASNDGGTMLPPIMVSDIIGTDGAYLYTAIPQMSDPLPQALMITAIVIGFSVTAVMIIILVTIYRRYRSTDWRVIIPLAKKDIKGEFVPYEEQTKKQVEKQPEEQDEEQIKEKGADNE